MIKLTNISKTFATQTAEVHAVKNVNMEIKDGEIFGIIGFSGAGKSTLVRCINLLERPTQGEVEINGLNMTSLSKKELNAARKKIGMIFQHFNLMGSRTVAENIKFPLKGGNLTKDEMDRRVKELLELVSLEDKADSYPSQLSGGQKQRVAIARALANDPSVLLCDEATSALDPQTTDSILGLLKDLNQKLKITIVVITHEMAVVKNICDRVAIMDGGRVVEIGDVFKIFSDPGEEITKSFIETTSNLKKVEALMAEKSPILELKPDEFLMQFTYIERTANRPLVSYISRQFNINVNILFGDIETIGGDALGGLVVIIDGERSDVENAVRFLIEQNVKVEVLIDGRAVTQNNS